MEDMKLTKLEHAALVLEDDGKKLFVDPGSFTTPITDAIDTVAIVITHEHADHWTPEQLNRILERSPDAVILGPEGVANAAADFAVRTVHADETVELEPFTLRFFGGKHAQIHSSIPIVDNLGVIVNDTLVYPGDSFAAPGLSEIEVLAVPSSAPWLKASEFIDYVLGLKPKHAFSTHEMVSSVIGKQMADGRIKWAVEQGGGHFLDLQPGDSYQI